MLVLFSSEQEQAVEMEVLDVGVDKWEIAVDRILLQDVIGRGAFGSVWRTLLSEPDGKPGNRTVAAKCFTRKILRGFATPQNVIIAAKYNINAKCNNIRRKMKY